jgi:uncharacterized membrane protein YphA (DoxX/SURF4 family)
MTIALIILAALLGVAAAGSAVQKLRRDARVVATMHSVGVSDRQIPILALLEILGALGLLVGIWLPLVGAAAAIGLLLYFLGAIIAHVRAKAPVKEAIPAAVLMVLALVTTLLELAR